MENFTSAHKSFKKSRAMYKAKITRTFNKLNQLIDDGTLDANPSLYLQFNSDLNKNLELVEDFDKKINDLLVEYDVESLDADVFNEELDSQDDYRTDFILKLSSYGNYENLNVVSSNDLSNVELVKAIKNITVEPKPPPLTCGTFNGVDTKLEFQSFLNQFNNAVGSNKNYSDSLKFSYLLSYLRDLPLKLVQHLPVDDSSFSLALSLLKKEYLDIPALKDKIYKKIIEFAPTYDETYESTKVYLAEVRSHLHDLKTHGYDFLMPDSPGLDIVSHIVMSKLPLALKRELMHKLETNYPLLNDIFDNYTECIKTLNKLKTKNSSKSLNNKKDFDFKKKEHFNNKVASLQNFKTENKVPKKDFGNFSTKNNVSKNNLYNQNKGKKLIGIQCKFCPSTNIHTMKKCDRYVTYNDRVKRCKDLGLCTRCTSVKHTSESDECPGKNGTLDFKCEVCQATTHITALHNSDQRSDPGPSFSTMSAHALCLNTNFDAKNYILPTLTLRFAKGKKIRYVRCLLDFGSMRSYFSHKVAQDLSDVNSLSSVEYEISTFIGSQIKSFKQFSVEINMPGSNALIMPILIDKDLKLDFEVNCMDLVVKNLTENGYNLADLSFDPSIENKYLYLDGLLGIDILQYLPSLNLVQCMNGSCFEINGKFIPIGNCERFLYKQEIADMNRSLNSNLNKKVPSKPDSEESTLVNFILSPNKSYFNPIDNICPESNIDNGLEKIFSLETLGIKETDNEICSYDQKKIAEFQNNIQFKDNTYYVKLPFYEDKIKQVPSNHKIAISALQRVFNDLESKNLTQEYLDVFNDQLKNNVIQKIDVNPSEYNNYIWIPHRPIIKSTPQCTFKIRPIFNCSLKTKNNYSINMSAYPGIDMMNSLLKLTLSFRKNLYVISSDVKKAFLSIRLSDQFDKDKFCFFLKEDGKITTYQYNTLLFGYVSSPFIMHYVMQHHASKFPDDKCTQILKNNFYCDNLHFTSNSLDEMELLYKTAYERMKQGNFILRSWCSNNESLNNLLKNDSNFTEHGLDEEMMLGYRFDFKKDVLKLSEVSLKSTIMTKREFLSETSKIFDVLNFTLPVTIKSRILLREICSINPKLDWDDKLPSELIKAYEKLAVDLTKLSEISFPRYSISTEETYGLHIFCDASLTSFGFVAYACDDSNQANFLFAKSKIAPLAKKLTIPTLELMSVVLVFKCLPTLLSAYSDVKFKFINICVDAQVVLSWLLTKEVDTKSKFVKNRLKDVQQGTDNIKNTYNLPIYFKYVETSSNPADLITKGISSKKFIENLDFYFYGPKFITNDLTAWPKYEMLSLSKEARTLVNLNLTTQTDTLFFDMSKYSSINKIYRILGNVLRFCNNARKINADYKQQAKLLALKLMQKECFSNEINFLKNRPKDKVIPTLVNNLNLFIDKNDLIRTDGRISKCTYFDENVCKPILLDKNHSLTKLIINDCHKKVQHLGIPTTLNFIRNQGYWIPQGRQAVKKALSTCFLCIRYNSMAFKYPRYTNLPKHRMNFVEVWKHCGIDYFGPIWIYNPDTKLSSKMYVLIFSDLNIRAVHLELLPDMSSRNFLLAFQRFCNLYTIPTYVLSDNAKSFTQSGKILSKSLNSSEFREFLEENNCKHLFIPVYSAWYGACYERLIGCVKNTMYKAIGKTKLDYFSMITLLSSIKNCINSRPLTYRSFNHKEIEPITPNSFLKFKTNPSLVLRSDEEDDLWKEEVNSENLTNTLTIQEETLEKFRKLWHEEYLLSLREHATKLYQSSWENKIKINDIVLIKLPNKPRPFWMLGRVTKLIHGDDNKVRSVQVFQSNGQTVLHAINHLYPMELSVTHSGTSQDDVDVNTVKNDATNNPDNDDLNPNVTSQSRPTRKTAAKCRRFIQDNLDYL